MTSVADRNAKDSPFPFSDWKSGKLPPYGWDAADAVRDGWTGDNLVEFIKNYLSPVKKSKRTVPDRIAELESGEVITPDGERAQSTEAGNVLEISKFAGPKLVEEPPWQRQLVHNADALPKPRAHINHALFLTHHPDVQGILALNEFSREIMMVRCPPWADESTWQNRPLQDHDVHRFVYWLESQKLAPNPTGLHGVIASVAEKNAFDPLADYLNGLRWDGKPRVADFLRDYVGGADTDYTRIISKRWLISAVARALKPGCKMDTMLVLEGPQGTLKSSAVRDLFGVNFFTDQISDFDSKDAKQELQGVWAIEVAEMDRITKAEQNAVKRFLSHQFDRYRPPYGRNVVKADRRCILVGTINPDGTGYLKDTTGARRFWPLKVGSIDLDVIQRDRDQIWAEAVTLFKNGESWWIQGDELDEVEEQQADRTEIDVWEEKLRERLAVHTGPISMSDCVSALAIPADRIERRHQMRIGQILRVMGYERKQVRLSDGRRGYEYSKPN